MERHRNDLKPFSVVSIPGLPGIDDYVCVPYKWVLCVRNNKDEIEKVVVAYPENEDPFQTRDRVRRLEEYNDEWRFFTSEIEYQSDNYEDAEFWIATRKQDNSNINVAILWSLIGFAINQFIFLLISGACSAEGGPLCVEGAAGPPGGSARDRDPPKLEYKLHRKFNVFNKSEFNGHWVNNFNLVASSPQHGVVFVASIDGHLEVYRVAELLGGEADPPRVTVKLLEKPVLISVNCDGELLAVGLQKSVLIYNVKDFRNQFAALELSVPRGSEFVRDMQWSPSMNETLAIGFCYKITTFHNGTGKKNDTKTTSCTRCLSWHPSGSSLVVGDDDGTLSVYSPDLTLEKRIPVPDPPLFDEAHLWVEAVNWMATNQFAVVYSDASTTGSESVFTLINASEGELPPRAEYVGRLDSGAMFPWFRMVQIKPWNVMLCIGSGKVVTELLLPDSDGGDSQAPVQLVSELLREDDLYLVGVAVDRVPVHLLSSQPHLEPTDETTTVLHVLTTTGDLATYIVSERPSTPSVDPESSATTPCSEPVALEPTLNDANGSFNASTASASPFGGGFKPTTNNAFGAQPAFGAAATAQPATGGGGGSEFGASTSTGGGPEFGANTSTGGGPGFGASTSTGGANTSTNGGPGFAASTSIGGGFVFAASTSTGSGFGFGASTSTGGGPGFGACTSTRGGPGFGASTLTGHQFSGLFGGMFGDSSQATSLFGTPTAQLFQAKLAGSSGQSAAPGTAQAKYNPVVGTDVEVKAGASKNINVKYQCIVYMKEYESKSLDELRLEDYTAGRGSAAKPLFRGFRSFNVSTASASPFGGGFKPTTNNAFGAQPAFGAAATAQPATGSGGGFGFGASTSTGGRPGFGASTSTGGGFGFGARTSTGGGFGFGARTSTGGGFGFGARTSTGGGFGFGASTSTGRQFGGLFGGIFGDRSQATPLLGTPTAQLFQAKLAAPCTGGAPHDLPPLGFHSVHGENIRISRDGSVARRVETSRGGVTFSARPVRVNEKVCIRLVEISYKWHGVIAFGFTTHDPTTLSHALPKTARPDLTNKPGNWARHLERSFCKKGSILYYFVNSAGDVHFGVNGEDKGLFFSGVDTRSPLWALVDVYGRCTAVQFADPRAPSLIRRPNQSPVQEKRLLSGMQTLSVDDPLPQLRYQSPLVPLSLHRTKGRNVQFINDRGVAARIKTDSCQGYVFTARPMRQGQTIVVQILSTETMYAGSLAIGLTSCDPATLRPCDLPDDAEQLLDRPEYWVVRRDAASGLGRGDELAITLTLDGEVRVSRNGSNPVTEMHVDHTVRLWAFVDIYGATRKVRMLCCQTAQPPPPQLRAGSAQNINTSGGTVLADSLSPQNAGQNANQQMTLASAHTTTTEPIQSNQLCSEQVQIPNERERDEPSTSTNTHSEIGERQLNDKECIICYENDKDSVLYMCGHMCMCYRCALQQWQGKGDGQCPLCRAEIKDVIRAYV